MMQGGGAGGGGGYQGGYLSFQQQQQYHGVGVGTVGAGSGSGWAPSCSLAKLQQMADAPQHHPPPHTPPAQATQVHCQLPFGGYFDSSKDLDAMDISATFSPRHTSIVVHNFIKIMPFLISLFKVLCIVININLICSTQLRPVRRRHTTTRRRSTTLHPTSSTPRATLGIRPVSSLVCATYEQYNYID